MTAPDSPAVAAVRRLADGYRRLAEVDGDPIGAATDADALDGVLAELDEARRQPRVWLEGDEVPAGVRFLDRTGAVNRLVDDWRVCEDDDGPFVEVLVPDFAAAVAAERERRTIAAEPPAEPPAATEASGGRSPGSVDVGPVCATTEPDRSGSREIDSAPRGPDLTATEAPEAPQTADGDLGPMPAPAERLRSAAAELERRAAAATHGPWQPEYAYVDCRVQAVFVECAAEDGCDGVDCLDGTHGIGGFDLDQDNRWSILANPDLARPLAAWLRAEADRPERRAWDDQVLYLAVDVADHILRGVS